MLDMNTSSSGNVTERFVDYTRSANRDLIERAFNGTDFLRGIPAQARNEMASYPEEFSCGLTATKTSAANNLAEGSSIYSLAPPLISILINKFCASA